MHNRPIVNTRDEPHADPAKYRRLHGIAGDANMSEYATALKVGTTALVIALIEQDKIPESLTLANPIDTIKTVSHDQTYRWIVMTADGKTISAIDHQREYLALAQKYLGERESVRFEIDWVLAEWEDTLDGLEKEPMALFDRLDWVAKKWLLQTFAEEEDIAWDDAWLQSLDLEYHNIDPDEGLYYGLPMRRIVTDEQIEAALHNPPSGTRAYFRGRAVDRFGASIKAIQWDSITFNVNGRAREVNLSALADAEIANQYNKALDESPDVATLIKKLRL
jgi:proteasome accessory factor A